MNSTETSQEQFTITTPNRFQNKIYHNQSNHSDLSSSSSTPLAERRKTQVSNYLISQDFKTDFAIKLNHLRQREMNINANTDHHNSLTPAHIKHPHTHQEKIAVTPPNLGHFHHLSMATSSSTKSKFPIVFNDQNSLKEEVETEDNSSSSSIRKGILSSRSSVRVCEDAEEQNARYEVIRKLADQLAEQIEQNDHLLYELGVVRSHNARLKSNKMDKDDELTCLNLKILKLESILANQNNNNLHRSLNSTILNSKNSSDFDLPLHPTPTSTENQFFKNQILSLKDQLKHVRNSLSQILLELNPSIDQSNDSFTSNILNHSHKLGTGLQSHYQYPSNSVGSRRHSWPMSHSKSTKIDNTNDQEINHAHSLASMSTGCDSDLFHKLHPLEVELFQCHEARITSRVSIQSLIDYIDKVECDIQKIEIGTETKRETEGIIEEEASSKIIIEENSRKIVDSEVVKVENKFNETQTMMKEESRVPRSLGEPPSTHTSHGNNSPLMSLASFGFAGWARKLTDNSSGSQEEIIPNPKPDGIDQIPYKSLNCISNQQHQLDSNSSLLSPPSVEETSSGLIKFGFKSLFNYSSNSGSLSLNHSVSSDTLVAQSSFPSQISSLVHPLPFTSSPPLPPPDNIDHDD